MIGAIAQIFNNNLDDNDRKHARQHVQGLNKKVIDITTGNEVKEVKKTYVNYDDQYVDTYDNYFETYYDKIAEL